VNASAIRAGTFVIGGVGGSGSILRADSDTRPADGTEEPYVRRPKIRAARLSDAADLAALVDIAGEGLPAVLWQQRAGPAQSPFEIGRARAMREEGGFSYRNAHIIEHDGAVAGALVGYPLEEDEEADLSDVPQLVRGLIDLERQVAGYWYVNILAVYPEHRGRGLGSRLLDHADRLSRTAGSKGLAIIVVSGNAGARRLYERHGYRHLATRSAPDYPGGRSGQDWLLLTKPHDRPPDRQERQ
jgi:ribosomal protein S18 acetylase RimI-like enzyme